MFEFDRSHHHPANHNSVAVALHAANHPTRGPSESWKTDPLDINGLDIEAVSFSPPCIHFSKVRKSVGEQR